LPNLSLSAAAVEWGVSSRTAYRLAERGLPQGGSLWTSDHGSYRGGRQRSPKWCCASWKRRVGIASTPSWPTQDLKQETIRCGRRWLIRAWSLPYFEESLMGSGIGGNRLAVLIRILIGLRPHRSSALQNSRSSGSFGLS